MVRRAQFGSGSENNPNSVNGNTVVSTDDDLTSVLNSVQSGDEVVLMPGEHTLTKSGNNAVELTGVDDVTIRGRDGEKAVIKLEDNAPTDPGTGDDEGMIALGVQGDADKPNGVVLKNLIIDGNKANNTTASDEEIHGVHFNGPNDYTIENVEIRNCTGGGLWGGPGGNDVGGKIDGLHVHDVLRDPVYLSTSDFRMTNFLIEDAPNQDGLELSGDGITVSTGVIRNTAGAGIELFRATNATVSNVVVFHGPNGPGIGFSHLANATSDAINNKYVGCTFVGSNDSAEGDVGWENDSTNTQDVEFRGCTAYQPGGTHVHDGELWKDCTIIEPQASNAVQTDATDAVIDGLTIERAAGVGIKTAGTASGATIRNATIDGASTGCLVTADDFTLVDPLVRNCDNAGVNVTGERCTVRGGEIKNNGDQGFISDEVGAVHIEGVTFDNNTDASIRFETNSGGTHSLFAIRDCTFRNETRAVNSGGSGSLQDVLISNSTLENVTAPFPVTSETRVVVGGESENSGSPASGGQWNGNAGLARRWGVRVHDSTSEGTFYVALPDSFTADWSQVSGTGV